MEIMTCVQDGKGKVNRLVNNTSRPYTFETWHSTDYGQTWNGFSVRTPSGEERVKELCAGAAYGGGDDNRSMFIRFVNRHGRLLDVHFYFYPDTSPKISAFATNDEGGWDKLWSLE